MSGLPNGWVDTTLEEIAEIHNVKRIPLSTKQRNQKKGIYPYYGASGIIDYIDEYIFDGEYVLISEDGENLNTRKTPIAFKAKGKFWVNNHAHIVKGINSHLNDYIIYYFKNTNLSPYITGAAQPKLSKNNLLSIPFVLPESKQEQKSIAKLLSSFDEKIELLREQNETLETLAQTIFKEWFVHFRYPGSESEKLKVKSEKLMVDSEFGEIPKGWRVGKIKEIIEIFDYQRIPLSSNLREKRKGQYPYYGATKIMDYIDDYIFDGTYLLLAEDGSVMDDNGHPILQYVWGKFWVNNHTHILQGKNGFSTEALYVFFKKQKITRIVNGAVQLKINQTNLLNFELVLPDDAALETFNELIIPVFEKIKNNTAQIQTLTKTRDTLLPKLMSSEIRVNNEQLKVKNEV